MDDFDPVPPVNPVFKGLVVSVLIFGLALAVVGLCALAVAVLT